MAFIAQLCLECGIAVYAIFAGAAFGLAAGVIFGGRRSPVPPEYMAVPFLAVVLAAYLADRRAREEPRFGPSLLRGKAGPWVAIIGGALLLYAHLACLAEEAGALRLPMGSNIGFAYAARSASDYIGLGLLFEIPGIAMLLYGTTRLILQLAARFRKRHAVA